jgi:hypothetical protein
VTWLPITHTGGGDASNGVGGAYRVPWRPATAQLQGEAEPGERS